MGKQKGLPLENPFLVANIHRLAHCRLALTFNPISNPTTITTGAKIVELSEKRKDRNLGASVFVVINVFENGDSNNYGSSSGSIYTKRMLSCTSEYL